MEVDVYKVKEHYEIYIDGNFNESCDLQEINSVLDEIKQNILKLDSENMHVLKFNEERNRKYVRK